MKICLFPVSLPPQKFPSTAFTLKLRLSISLWMLLSAMAFRAAGELKFAGELKANTFVTWEPPSRPSAGGLTVRQETKGAASEPR